MEDSKSYGATRLCKMFSEKRTLIGLKTILWLYSDCLVYFVYFFLKGHRKSLLSERGESYLEFSK